MSLSRKIAYSTVGTRAAFLKTYLLISVLWYISLYPGRLGFDYSKAIKMIQDGESTSWWTSSFWWYLRIFSFNGRSIALVSLICLAALGFSLYYVTESLPGKKHVNRFALLLLSLTPLYGAFGVNVSHDVFQAAGILIFTGFQIRITSLNYLKTTTDLAAILAASAMVLTTHYGFVLIIINVILFIIRGFRMLGATTGFFSVAFLLITPIGITQVPTYGLVIPIMGDLKCIAQHKMAELNANDWNFLESIAPKKEWVEPKTCSFIDYSLEEMSSVNLADVKLDKDLVVGYLQISAKNPAIVAMAHFQRASIALPPPFFYGPPNQVIRDPDVPIGDGTNNALQSYPGVLHPSIDEPSVDSKIKILAPFEALAQGLIFIVNQASWFWGWGGLWLWPSLLFFMVYLKGRGAFARISIFANILGIHSLLLILSSPLPRYVIATILLGLLLSIVVTLRTYLRTSIMLLPELERPPHVN